MTRLGQYDSELQMFVVEARELDLSRVLFLRWLAERGRLEHEVASESKGDLVLLVSATTAIVEA